MIVYLNQYILFKLSYTVELTNGGGMSYRIIDMECGDIDLLDKIFRKMHSKFEITGNEYLTKCTPFTNQMNKSIQFKRNCQWNIEILIRGYMINRDGMETPLWKIYTAQIA